MNLEIFNATKDVTVRIRKCKPEAELDLAVKKVKKKSRPRNLIFVGLKLEARIKDTIDDVAISRGLGFSEMMRQVILSGMETMGIKYREEAQEA